MQVVAPSTVTHSQAADEVRRRRVGGSAAPAMHHNALPMAVAMTGAAHAQAGVMQMAAERGPILWPIGLSLVGGTLGAIAGGLWPSLIGGTVGWLAGELLR